MSGGIWQGGMWQFWRRYESGYWKMTDHSRSCGIATGGEGENTMREIAVKDITKEIADMCIQANHYLSEDMDQALKVATKEEKSPLGKKILEQLQENLMIADQETIPICQDTGMAVVFMEIGQDVHFVGGSLEDAINEGVRQGYIDGYLRKSVVGDPIERVNTRG